MENKCSACSSDQVAMTCEPGHGDHTQDCKMKCSACGHEEAVAAPEASAAPSGEGM